MRGTEHDKQERLVQNSKDESDMEWILACPLILLIAAVFIFEGGTSYVYTHCTLCRLLSTVCG